MWTPACICQSALLMVRYCTTHCQKLHPFSPIVKCSAYIYCRNAPPIARRLRLLSEDSTHSQCLNHGAGYAHYCCSQPQLDLYMHVCIFISLPIHHRVYSHTSANSPSLSPDGSDCVQPPTPQPQSPPCDLLCCQLEGEGVGPVVIGHPLLQPVIPTVCRVE